MGCFSGCLMSAASDLKLFCKLCSPFNCSFDEFVGEKVVSPSYSSAILTPPPGYMEFLKAEDCSHNKVLATSNTSIFNSILTFFREMSICQKLSFLFLKINC